MTLHGRADNAADIFEAAVEAGLQPIAIPVRDRDGTEGLATFAQDPHKSRAISLANHSETRAIHALGLAISAYRSAKARGYEPNYLASR